MQGRRIPRKTPAGWRLDAPAKVNAYLDVLPRRADGFHGIRTLLCPVRLSDSLLLRPDSSLRGRVNLEVCSLNDSIDVRSVPTDENNLVARALRAVWDTRGIEGGCHVEIGKRIPSQAGLGGGSSDAAAAIVAANHIWDLQLSEQELLTAAAQVGSDVPGQLSGGANLCEGRGELVTPARVPSGLPCVIAKPRQGLSTAEVFRRCAPTAERSEGRLPDLLAALARGDWRRLPELLLNQLQAAALDLCEELRGLSSAFDQLPIVAHQMTGSGSAYFGLCRSHRQAQQAAAWLRGRKAVWACATCTA